jgi:hypothetical protein
VLTPLPTRQVLSDSPLLRLRQHFRGFRRQRIPKLLRLRRILRILSQKTSKRSRPGPRLRYAGLHLQAVHLEAPAETPETSLQPTAELRSCSEGMMRMTTLQQKLPRMHRDMRAARLRRLARLLHVFTGTCDLQGFLYMLFSSNSRFCSRILSRRGVHNPVAGERLDIPGIGPDSYEVRPRPSSRANSAAPSFFFRDARNAATAAAVAAAAAASMPSRRCVCVCVCVHARVAECIRAWTLREIGSNESTPAALAI